MQPRGTLLRYDLDARKLMPYLSGVAAHAFHSSWDGEWIVYAKQGTLWRSKPDGSQRLQLTSTPMGIWSPRWSPDGKRIAFMGKEEGKLWKIYVVSAEGGTPQQLVPGERNQADPSWSPDGQSMLFGRLPDPEAEASAPKAIHVFNLKTKQVTKLPGSDGLFGPSWSPDGRYVSASTLDIQKVMLFDFTTRKWMELADHPHHNSTWSRDGKYIYFQGLFFRGDMDIYRVRISDHKLERVANLKELLPANVVLCKFLGLTPDSSPVAECWYGSSDIYALDWQVP
jgi:Tol biopolymer transport system component